MTLRAWLLALAATALLAGLLVAVPGAARACACGAAYVPDGHTVRAGEELALLSWAKPGQERLEMGLSLSTDTADLAVLVPTPAAPRVTQGDSQTFAELATLTAPRSSDETGGDGNGNGAAAPQQAPSVLSTTKLDDVVATVIQGGTPGGVTRWLKQHGYAQKPQVTPAIAAYLRDGWVFTAVKLRGDKPFDGQIDPLVLTFASAQLVYPMRLSSTAAEVGTVTVYTLDRTYDGRTDRAGLADTRAEALRTITPQTYAAGPLHTLAAAGNTRLTKFVYAGLEPADLTSDFTYAADPQAHPTRTASAAPAGEHVSGDGGDGGVPPWAVGLIAFGAACALGGIGLGLRGARRSPR